MSSEQQPIDPTIIIGVGGAGCGMVADIRDMIRNDVVVGEKDSVDERFQYIAIDSDESDTMPKLEESDKNVLEIDLDKGGIGIEDARTDMDSDEYHYLSGKAGYAPEDMSGGVGAERNRAIGRYCLNKHHEDVRGKISERIKLATDEFSEMVGDDSTTLNTVHVWIVNSLCGGTGSGSFIELAALVKDVVEEEFDTKSGEVGSGDFNIKGVGSLLVWDESYDSNFRTNAYASLEDITKTVRKERNNQDKKLRIPLNEDIDIPGHIFDEYFLQPIDYDLDEDIGKQDGYRRQRNRVIGSVILLYSKTGGAEDIRTDYLATLSDRERSSHRINALAGVEIKAPMGGIYAYSVRDKAIDQLSDKEGELKDAEKAYEKDIEYINNTRDISVVGPFLNDDQSAHEWTEEGRIEEELSESMGDEPTVDELEDSSFFGVETDEWSEALKSKVEKVVDASISTLSGLSGGKGIGDDEFNSKKTNVIEAGSTNIPDSRSNLEYYDGNKEDDDVTEYIFSQIVARHLADEMRDHEFQDRTEDAEEVYESVIGELNPAFFDQDDPRKKWDDTLIDDFYDKYDELSENLSGIIATILSYIGIPFTMIGTPWWVWRKQRAKIDEIVDNVYEPGPEGEPEVVDGGLYDQYQNLWNVYSAAKRSYEDADEELDNTEDEYTEVKRILNQTRTEDVETKRELYEEQRKNIMNNISPSDEDYNLRPNNDHAAWIDLPVVMEKLGKEIKKTSKDYIEKYYGVEQEIMDELKDDESGSDQGGDDDRVLDVKELYEIQLEDLEDKYDIQDVEIDCEIERGDEKSINSLYSTQDLFEEKDIADAFSKARDRLDGFEMLDRTLDPDEQGDVESPAQSLMMLWSNENTNLTGDISESGSGESLEEIINSFGKDQTSKLSINDPYRVWMTLLYSGLEGMIGMSEYIELRKHYKESGDWELSEAFVYPELHEDDTEIGNEPMDFHEPHWLERDEGVN